MTEKLPENRTEKKNTRFSGLLNRTTAPADPIPEVKAEPEPAAPPPPPAVVAPKMGRPAGKKTNPEYTQVTVYLRKEVHRQAKKLLIDDGREFSELVDELVSRWASDTQSSGSLKC
jgi:hypothetical protein